MSQEYGPILKNFRLTAGIGLSRFAEMIGMKTSNLSALEHGRRNAPTEPDRLREIAEALGLAEGSGDWNLLFDAARREGELPADVRHVASRRLIPALLRTIDNQQLDDDQLARLIADLEGRDGALPHGG